MVAVDPRAEAVLNRINRDEVLALALALGNIESPTGYEGPACDFVYDWMHQQGFQPERVGAFDDRYNVVGRLVGSGGGYSLAFNSHLDTIIARTDTLMYLNADDPVYHTAWYDAEHDQVWGAGIVNCKGPMACWLVAAKALAESGVELKGDLVLTSVVGEVCVDPVDEFQGHRYLAGDIGTRYAITHGAIADFALVAEATGFKPGWVEAGKAFFKITVTAGPSRYTPYMPRPLPMAQSPNAIVRMAKLIERLEAWADDYEQRYTREYAGGTVVPKVSIGAIRGGLPYRIYRQPELCHIYVDVRLNPDTEPLQVQAELQALASELAVPAEIKPFLYRRGFEARGVEPLVEAVTRAHVSLFGRQPERPSSPEVSMWRDINPYNELGIPAMTYGPGGAIGGGNFCFPLDDMVRAARVYALTALDFCNRPKRN
jgi:acetylornithine deacetylase/succinyl-diaminopimelate desuccinylase-like protein